MISSAIESALQGLQASAKRSEIASRNITSATQSGYVRRETAYSSGPLGLHYDGVVRASDPELATASNREHAQLDGLEIELAARKAVADRLGDPRDGNDLGSTLQDLADSFSRLGDRPEDTTVQNDVLSRAGDVTDFLHAASQEVQNQRLQADGAIGDDVDYVNERLQQIADLNDSISSAPKDSDTSDFQDQREQAVAEISSRLPLRLVPQANGAVTLLTDKGVVLVDAKVHKLQFTTTQAIEPAAAYQGAPPLSGLSVDGIDLTTGSGAPQAPSEGRLAANLRLRDVTLPQAQAQLDEVAKVLASSFQAADATVTDPATQPGLFTDGGGAIGPVTGLAQRIAVNSAVDPAQGGQTWRLRTGVYTADPADAAATPASDPGVSGDGTQARAFAALFDQTASFDPALGLAPKATLVTYANQLTNSAGHARTALESTVTYQRSLVSSLDSRLADATGVDLDKELQDTMLFEKSYAASAMVLQTATQMLDTLLQHL